MATGQSVSTSTSPTYTLIKPNSDQPASVNHTEKPTISDSAPVEAEQHRLEKWVDWGIKVFGFAAAITFGIWAPLSYTATADGNDSNNAAQATAMSMQSSILAAQESMVTAQSSLADMQSSINLQLSAMGKMNAINFCLAHPVCYSTLWGS